MNKISFSISLMLVFTLDLKSDTCGTSYALPSGGNRPTTAVFSPDGAYLATSNNGDNVTASDHGAGITIFNVSEAGVLSGGVTYALPTGSKEPSSLAFSPNGSYLVVSNYSSNTITLFTVSSGMLSGGTSYSLPVGSSAPNAVVFSPDGTLIATANMNSADVTVFTVGTGGVLSEGTSYSPPFRHYHTYRISIFSRWILLGNG